VIRFEGEALGDAPRIAVISNDALGNSVVITPLLQMLRAKHPGAELVYFSGTRSAELWRGDESISSGFSFLGAEPRIAVAHVLAMPTFDWVINVESNDWARMLVPILAGPEGRVTGPCIDAESRGRFPFEWNLRGTLWEDREWISESLPMDYPFLQTGFIGELFCRLAYCDGDVPRYKVHSEDPGRELPDVLIAMSASLPEKLWPVSSWVELLNDLKARGVTVGLLGAKPKSQGQYWKGLSDEDAVVSAGLVADLRGMLTLPQVAGALSRVKAVFTLDNGIMHLASAFDQPVVALFRHGIHRLWTPPYGNVVPLVSTAEGTVADIPVSTAKEALIGVL
jgi:hypothetical protein